MLASIDVLHDPQPHGPQFQNTVCHSPMTHAGACYGSVGAVNDCGGCLDDCMLENVCLDVASDAQNRHLVHGDHRWECNDCAHVALCCVTFRGCLVRGWERGHAQEEQSCHCAVEIESLLGKVSLAQGDVQSSALLHHVHTVAHAFACCRTTTQTAVCALLKPPCFAASRFRYNREVVVGSSGSDGGNSETRSDPKQGFAVAHEKRDRAPRLLGHVAPRKCFARGGHVACHETGEPKLHGSL